MKLKLSEINIDSNLSVREPSSHIIADYRDAMKSGATFPPLLLDQNHVVIDGLQRYTAMIGIYPEDELISVTVTEFKSDKDRITAAIKSNREHGLRFDHFEEKNLALRLKKLGAIDEEIASILGRTLGKIEKWGMDTIVVIQPNGSREEKVRKGGIAPEIEEITEAVHKVITDHYSGWNPTFHINQIKMNIEQGTMSVDESMRKKLEELCTIIKKWLGK